ncbi:unnamed protein product [Rhizophagus irregularis]|uniref:Uncharacterized protein n=1 Tax=Rhizophagus irregularis TaxID=588596 RepID=A0A915ZT44_9GLOM|nr:unnamed protein product [Rhizophagus irregularis]CAB4474739.1 unnamed protein product [Rhizophagus irregularis]CAB5365543.1 unnamed protein product [Rhizophagus irregularis]CAB5386102.1 unnamed protein product [Rhizophagus irregularis]
MTTITSPQQDSSSDIQIKFSLCPRKDLENNNNNNKRQYKFFKHTDREKDQRITEFFTRLYRISFESHVQGCTEEHVLLNKDKLDEIINSIISSDIRKKIEESILLHSNLYELIIPQFKCHGLGYYYKPDSVQEIFIKNLEPCYYETCPMYSKHLDSSSCMINYLERWNIITDDEKQVFEKISLCSEKVFELMYPNYKEINDVMNKNNLDFDISIEFNQRNLKLFNNDEKDKSLFVDRREMNLRSIQRCSKLLDNLSDGSSNKEKNEIQNNNLERQIQLQLLLLQPNSQSWKKVGKRFVVTLIISLILVIATSLGCYFLNI